MSEPTLLAAWRTTCASLGLRDGPGQDLTLGHALIAAWSEPQRHYHALQHLQECLAALDRWRHLAQSPELLALALWFHDAVYDPQARDNEARSADMARRDLRELDASIHAREEVARLILLTAGHTVEEEDRLGELMVSIDLAVLGAPAPDYDQYARDVRAEYAHIPDEAWRLGRTAVLERFLAAERIFPDQGFHDSFELQARGNLQRELQALVQG